MSTKKVGARSSDQKCSKCSATLSPYDENCLVCGLSAGPPNVRVASAKVERDALRARRASAEVAAIGAGCVSELTDFELFVAQSDVVLVRSLGALDSFVHNDNQLLLTFHQAVRAKGRVPETNEWDPRRESVDAAINPYIYEKLHYAALSGDGRGVESFGGYHVTLREKAVELRTTVFEENGFPFLDRHHNRVPHGYRAVWAERGVLGAAKLHSKLSPGMARDRYPAILLDQGVVHGDSDFVEAHIYGPLHRRAIRKVAGPRPKRLEDNVLWKKIRRSLKDVGAEVQET